MANLTGFKKDQDGLYIDKSPSSNIQYGLDFTDYLNSGDTVASATVTIEAITGDAAPLAFPTNAGTDVSISGTKAILRVSAGTAGNIYPIEVKIVTADGDTDSRHFRLIVKNKELA